MWIFTKALGSRRPVIVAPQAFVEDEIGGYSWWKIGKSDPTNKTKRISESYLNEPVEKLESFIESLPSLYGVDLNKLVAFGFSQGAGMLAALSAKRPELFKGVGLLSGFLPSPARFELENSNINLPKIFMFHGVQDQTINFDRAKSDEGILRKYSSELTFVEDDVGHKVSSKGVKALELWLAQFEL